MRWEWETTITEHLLYATRCLSFNLQNSLWVVGSISPSFQESRTENQVKQHDFFMHL